ncbi:MAG: HesA/MoeB/ThiF family protein [Muribaculaceae bacterium]|nr:HesA/MoeB/ThiF family protein [Muribaculaceae bacterium]
MTRYSRNIKIIGAEGQKCLSASSVLIIGCGALGGQIAMLLAGAGIGRIGIVDYDNVSISNLQRQVFFKEGDIEHYKSETLASRMLSLNSEIGVKAYVSKFNTETADLILNDGYDFVVDATDSPQAKLNIELECRKRGLPLSSAGVKGWTGQVITVVGDSLSLSQVYPDLLNVKNEDELGVMGPTPAVAASIQASEVIKYLTGEGELLINRIMTFDLSTMSFNSISL